MTNTTSILEQLSELDKVGCRMGSHLEGEATTFSEAIKVIETLTATNRELEDYNKNMVGNYQDEINQLESRITGLKEAYEFKCAQLGKAEERTVLYLSKEQQTFGQLTSAVSRIAELEGDNVRLKNNLEAAENDKSKLISHVDLLEDDLTASNGQIAELEKEREWVSVDERLPEHGGIYNVSVTGPDFSSFGFASLDDDEWKQVHQGDDHQDFDCGFAQYGMTVTHWMPLPTQPIEE